MHWWFPHFGWLLPRSWRSNCGVINSTSLRPAARVCQVTFAFFACLSLPVPSEPIHSEFKPKVHLQRTDLKMFNRTSHRYGAIPNSEGQNAPVRPWNDQTVFASHQPTLISSIKHILFSNWINLLLVFVPLGIFAHALHWNDTLIFVFNFLALLPMAKLLGLATEEVSRSYVLRACSAWESIC